MKEKILSMLVCADDYISGEMLCEELGVSRTAVWNNVKKLILEGYQIDAINNRGYRLLTRTNTPRPGEISDLLNTKYMGREGIYFDEIPSTNTYLKGKADGLPEGYIAVCDFQSQGRGRLGRTWQSTKGESIICSILLKPKLDLKDVSKITLLGALAIRRGLFGLGIDALIKWPNDIVIGGRKVCGILTEMASELGEIRYVVLGFGINVYQESFGDDIIHGASLKSMGYDIDRRQLTAKILDEFELIYDIFSKKGSIDDFLGELNTSSATVGKEVIVVRGESRQGGIAKAILGDGSLKIQYEDGEELVYYGEVSVRGIYDYV